MVSPRTRYQRIFAAALIVGVGAISMLLYVFTRAVLSPEVQEALTLVAARCVGRLNALVGQVRPQHVLGLGVPLVTVSVFLSTLLRHVRATRRLRRSLPTPRAGPEPPAVRRARELVGLRGRDVAVLPSSAPWCFCLGLLRPKIILSAAAVSRLQPDELAAVLAHERHHLTQRDPLRQVLIAAFQQALFFLPLVRALQRRYEVAQEVAADEAALGLPGGKFALASALSKLAPADGPVGSAAFAAMRTMAARVAFLDGRPFLSGTVTLVQVFTSLIMLAGILWYLTPPTHAHVKPSEDCSSMDSHPAPAEPPLRSPFLLAQGEAAVGGASWPPRCVDPGC